MTINAVAIVLLALLPLFVQSQDDIAFFPENGHYYQVLNVNKPISYDDAKTMAAARSHNSKQGYPVTIGTQSEQTFLNQYLNSTLLSMTANGDWPTIWGGAQMSSNSWTWNALGRVSTAFFDANKLTCYNYGYCNWNVSYSAANFPSNLACLQIYLNNVNGPTPGTWRPAACTNAYSQALVVEYDASQTCDAGYVYRTTKGWCEDVNECANNPKTCGAGYQCVNTIGSYRCDDIDECQNATICRAGFQCVNGNGTYSCVDINECKKTPSVCQSGYDCTNTIGSYQCSDINECSQNASLCRKGYVCENTPGSYNCNDFDECTQSVNNPCPFASKCSNTVGSYTCDSYYFHIQSQYNPDVVLDYFTDSNGILRVITNYRDPNNGTNQLWSFTPQGFLINKKTGYVADAEGGLVYPGVPLILWPQKTTDKATNQLWEYDTSTYYWASQTANVVFDIYHGQYNPPATICLFTPKNDTSTNQLWNVVE